MAQEFNFTMFHLSNTIISQSYAYIYVLVLVIVLFQAGMKRRLDDSPESGLDDKTSARITVKLTSLMLQQL